MHSKCNKIYNNIKENIKMILKIEGMMCPKCVKHVDKALNGVEGAADVVVSLDEKQATVQQHQNWKQHWLQQLLTLAIK
jgi:cation transport ATPase